MAFPWIAIQLGVGVSLWAVNKFILSDDEEPPTQSPPKALKLPRAGVGTPLPLAYGTYRLDSPAILWAGNNALESDGHLGLKRCDLFFCGGVPASDIHSDWRATNPPRLMAVWVNGQRLELAGGAGLLHGETATIGATFGVPDDHDYFQARVVFFDGRADQVVTDDLFTRNALNNANLGIPIDVDLVPGYAHQIVVAIITSPGAYNVSTPTDTGALGRGQTLVSIGLELQAYGPTPVVADDTRSDANPAMILYDLICGRVWKLGYSTDKVDKDSFDAGAATLANEAHGASGTFGVPGDADALIVALLDQINGIIIEDRTTKKLKLKLIRDDYNPNAIPVLDENNTVGTPQVTFVGWADLVNRVDVEFTDRSLGFVSNHATAVRGANAVGQANRVRPRTVRYPCVHSQASAKKLAARELGISARPLLTANCRVMRTMHALEPGDAVKSQWPGIAEGVVFRVLDVDDGQRADGAIGLTLIEDVFNETLGSFDPGTPDWPVNPELPDILDPDPE